MGQLEDFDRASIVIIHFVWTSAGLHLKLPRKASHSPQGGRDSNIGATYFRSTKYNGMQITFRGAASYLIPIVLFAMHK